MRIIGQDLSLSIKYCLLSFTYTFVIYFLFFIIIIYRLNTPYHEPCVYLSMAHVVVSTGNQPARQEVGQVINVHDQHRP